MTEKVFSSLIKIFFKAVSIVSLSTNKMIDTVQQYLKLTLMAFGCFSKNHSVTQIICFLIAKH